MHLAPIPATVAPMSTPIAAYAACIPAPLRDALAADAEPVEAIDGLTIARGLRKAFPHLETDDALACVVDVYRQTAAELAAVLEQRRVDRAFIDRTTAALRPLNADKTPRDPDYATVIGRRDGDGRVVVGPTDTPPPERAPVEVPPHLRGEQVTLFGPPDDPRMAINAMNALHRRRPDEPPLVAELVAEADTRPRWGADDEDSQTPIMRRFLTACDNLVRCYDRTLTFERPGKTYRLADDALADPIKRIPGLALPDGSHLLDGHPLPLHLYDLVTHVWHNRNRPEALVFYVPKLETEAEATYLRHLLEATTAAVRARDPNATDALLRVLLVFESPRSIFRIREMAAALGPHFLGGSLGWHDFLAATARVFRHDPGYRIPVKADPDIVVNHIKASHVLLAEQMHAIGGLAIGGMYGVLFHDGDPASYTVSIVGYIRDVITQLRRGLDGFWVAHPDFVRIGVALVAAWRRRESKPGDDTLARLVRALVPDPAEHRPLLAFIDGPDVPGLAPDDPLYPRRLLAADGAESDVIAADHPDEVRYNVFQALQYLAAWLDGTGCVALPATLRDAHGEAVPVRIMDDLATTERSRWELWAEIHHGRVAVDAFDAILTEEIEVIRDRRDPGTRQVQVPWTGTLADWYPIAVRVLRQLVCDPDPVEAVPELLLPFTFPVVRDAADPLATARRLCPGRYAKGLPDAVAQAIG